ncbi:hypothetical protein CHARACLAT_029691 [Characodon lateralis]|uniref:Uncharacterized protein n=1 Tax=Characodon lateralis TaxID=208331 RepID=A0ABU7ENX0_9TELE|nr:hypothetical protein [Characodon lateralis]
MFPVVLNEVCSHCKRDFGPLIHTDLLQSLQVSGLSLSNTDFHLLPKIFDWFQVWTLGRTLQNLEILFTEPLLSCPLLQVVVMLEDPSMKNDVSTSMLHGRDIGVGQ